MDGTNRAIAATLTFAVVASLLGSQPASAASGPTIQRIKGTIGFASSSDGRHNDVVTSASMPDTAEAFSDCSSLAAVQLLDGAVVTLGGKTDFVTPPAAGGPGNLKFGAISYDLTGRPPLPFVVATQYGTVFVAHGSGYIVAGSTGVQAVVRSGEKNDAMFVANNVVSVIPTGQSLFANSSGKPTFAANSSVNNSALYQFNDGRNPLGTDDTAVNDPASSPSAECNGLVAASAAGGSAALIAGLLGAGAIAVAVGHGGGGNSTPAPTQPPTVPPTHTPTQSPTGAPTGATTPTPVATATATAQPTATPTTAPTATPSPAATATPTAAATATPTAAATSTPTAVATSTPTAAATSTPTAVATSTPTAVATSTPTAVATATPTAVATASPTPVPTTSATGALGPVILNPSSILLSPAIGSPATSTFTASQAGYSGPFTVSQPTCPVGLLGTPSSSVSGSTITVRLPAQLVAISLLCSVNVTGGGGDSANEPMDIVITAVGGATPTPSPTSSAFGPVIANPASVLLNPAIGSPATQTISVTQMGYTGAFTVVLDGCLGIGAPPTATVHGDQVIFSLPAQTVGLDLGCSAVITGGGGQSATVPVTISVSALGSPTPSPTSSGMSGNGPLTASPATILLDPSAAAPATANIIVSPSSEGPFTATTTCAIPLGSGTITSVTGSVVTVTAPAQTLTAPIGCDTVIVSPSTGNSVTVPITVTATAVGPAEPTPSPNPMGHGPLYTVPSSILINPGVTTDATQNIEIFDAHFTGKYTAAVAAGCLALQQPAVSIVDGNVASVTVPGQLLNAALLCNITISDGTQTVEVPVTISATVLAGLDVKTRTERLAFRPPTVSLDRAGDTQSIEMIGTSGPYRANASCPAGSSLDTTISGERATVRAATVGASATCMLTITAASGTFGQVPIRVGSPFLEPGTAPLVPGRLEPAAQNGSLSLRAGEHRDVSLGGPGPYAMTGSCPRFADFAIDGTTLRVSARAAGSCTFAVRASNGVAQNYALTVREESVLHPIGSGLAAPGLTPKH